jgi:hypothetical protein
MKHAAKAREAAIAEKISAVLPGREAQLTELA